MLNIKSIMIAAIQHSAISEIKKATNVHTFNLLLKSDLSEAEVPRASYEKSPIFKNEGSSCD